MMKTAGVLQKEAKQHKDSMEQFNNAGRDELAAKEEAELAMLQTYLPKQMSEEAIQQLVSEAIQQTGATSIADLGKVMSALMPQTKGNADGALVSKLVREALQYIFPAFLSLSIFVYLTVLNKLQYSAIRLEHLYMRKFASRFLLLLIR
jgi:Glu-tRNA(Gln) amidotransferase subunit E-like FAD-binding protein